eukprot:9987597-Ditylum_brightwellii.AAC.1
MLGIRRSMEVSNKVLYLLNALKMVQRCKLGSTQMAWTIMNGICHGTIIPTLRREGMYGRLINVFQSCF